MACGTHPQRRQPHTSASRPQEGQRRKGDRPAHGADQPHRRHRPPDDRTEPHRRQKEPPEGGRRPSRAAKDFWEFSMETTSGLPGPRGGNAARWSALLDERPCGRKRPRGTLAGRWFLWKIPESYGSQLAWLDGARPEVAHGTARLTAEEKRGHLRAELALWQAMGYSKTSLTNSR